VVKSDKPFSTSFCQHVSSVRLIFCFGVGFQRKAYLYVSGS
jgi:hypothetical protein